MSAEKSLGLHEFRSPTQPPLEWNSIYGAVSLLDKVGFPPPVELEVGGRDSGLVNVCLSPAEAGKLGEFLHDYELTIAAHVAEVESSRGGNPSEAVESTLRLIDDAIFWFTLAFKSGNYVTVVPVPLDESKM